MPKKRSKEFSILLFHCAPHTCTSCCHHPVNVLCGRSIRNCQWVRGNWRGIEICSLKLENQGMSRIQSLSQPSCTPSFLWSQGALPNLRRLHVFCLRKILSMAWQKPQQMQMGIQDNDQRTTHVRIESQWPVSRCSKALCPSILDLMMMTLLITMIVTGRGGGVAAAAIIYHVLTMLSALWDIYVYVYIWFHLIQFSQWSSEKGIIKSISSMRYRGINI